MPAAQTVLRACADKRFWVALYGLVEVDSDEFPELEGVTLPLPLSSQTRLELRFDQLNWTELVVVTSSESLTLGWQTDYDPFPRTLTPQEAIAVSAAIAGRSDLPVEVVFLLMGAFVAVGTTGAADAFLDRFDEALEATVPILTPRERRRFRACVDKRAAQWRWAEHPRGHGLVCDAETTRLKLYRSMGLDLDEETEEALNRPPTLRYATSDEFPWDAWSALVAALGVIEPTPSPPVQPVSAVCAPGSVSFNLYIPTRTPEFKLTTGVSMFFRRTIHLALATTLDGGADVGAQLTSEDVDVADIRLTGGTEDELRRIVAEAVAWAGPTPRIGDDPSMGGSAEALSWEGVPRHPTFLTFSSMRAELWGSGGDRGCWYHLHSLEPWTDRIAEHIDTHAGAAASVEGWRPLEFGDGGAARIRSRCLLEETELTHIGLVVGTWSAELAYFAYDLATAANLWLGPVGVATTDLCAAQMKAPFPGVVSVGSRTELELLFREGPEKAAGRRTR